jgi:hypothetical protein
MLEIITKFSKNWENPSLKRCHGIKTAMIRLTKRLFYIMIKTVNIFLRSYHETIY